MAAARSRAPGRTARARTATGSRSRASAARATSPRWTPGRRRPGFTRSIVMKAGLAPQDVLAGAVGRSDGTRPRGAGTSLARTDPDRHRPDARRAGHRIAAVGRDRRPRSTSPFKIKDRKALPKGIQASVRWDPIDVAIVAPRPGHRGRRRGTGRERGRHRPLACPGRKARAGRESGGKRRLAESGSSRSPRPIRAPPPAPRRRRPPRAAEGGHDDEEARRGAPRAPAAGRPAVGLAIGRPERRPPRSDPAPTRRRDDGSHPRRPGSNPGWRPPRSSSTSSSRSRPATWSPRPPSRSARRRFGPGHPAGGARQVPPDDHASTTRTASSTTRRPRHSSRRSSSGSPATSTARSWPTPDGRARGRHGLKLDVRAVNLGDAPGATRPSRRPRTCRGCATAKGAALSGRWVPLSAGARAPTDPTAPPLSTELPIGLARVKGRRRARPRGSRPPPASTCCCSTSSPRSAARSSRPAPIPTMIRVTVLPTAP